ncbi:hypothetical protein N8I77_003325 [Diaporthe amygdali]|uniref:F-box domain-containing protein n=1 Tax=Phomopsis amygdali TaxID=1214568 RepID=A0AAD9W6M6_PHOAM|nr:hypothetical protein N8I77_003325 [Diaporthe amygdali]
MAAARDPGSHLDRLPDELLLQITEQEWCLSVRDLISLACTSRRYYRIAIPVAYKAHVKDEHGVAIYWAIENEEFGTLKRLVESGVDVNVLDENGLLWGTDVLFNIHDYYYNIQNDVHPPSGAHFSPLACAASHGQDSVVEYLLDHGADIESESAKLCSCCSELLRGPEFLPNRPEFYDRDPDYVDERPANMCPYADPDDCVSWWTPLHYAICNQHASTAELLIRRGANSQDVGGDVTALHIATRWEMEETIDYLIDNDLVDIDAQNRNGVTALHMAYIADRDDLVDDYLDHGADINLAYSDQSGSWTIFAMACADMLFEQALQYLRIGADPHFLFEDDDDDPWTVMRFIWGRGDSRDYPLEEIEARVALEQEIIAGSSASKSSAT